MQDADFRHEPSDPETEKALLRAERANWPIRMFRVGEEPEEDLTATTTMEERLLVMAELAVFAYALAGHPYPTAPWSEMPFTVRRGGPRPSSERAPPKI